VQPLLSGHQLKQLHYYLVKLLPGGSTEGFSIPMPISPESNDGHIKSVLSLCTERAASNW